MKQILYILAVLISATLITSCSPPNENAHPVFLKAQKMFEDGEFENAANGYQEYLDFNRKSSLTHRKLAELYRDYLDDAFLAAYHYRQLLHYNPNYSDKEAIEIWIASAEKDFAKKIQKDHPNDFISQEEVEKLKSDKERLIVYAIKLKKQNAILLKNRKSRVSASSDDKYVASGVKEIYTVKSGDNLQKISREVYGKSKYYRLIFDANRDSMKSESQLKIGQKLNIPNLKLRKDAIKKEEKQPSEESSEFM